MKEHWIVCSDGSDGRLPDGRLAAALHLRRGVELDHTRRARPALCGATVMWDTVSMVKDVTCKACLRLQLRSHLRLVP